MSCKLDSILTGRDLSLQDSEFVECVVYDVQIFVKNCNDNAIKSVLVFPPVNNYRRFLIHKVVEEQSQDLSTFSIGQGHARRTVVCFKRHVIKKPILQNDNESVTSTMGVDHHQLDGSANNTALSHETATKRAKAVPAVGIYRPPAARKLEQQLLPTPVPPEKPRSAKARRPDIQVYVPRAKRLEVNRKCSLGLSSDASVDSKAACSDLSENKKNQKNRLSASNLVITTNSSPPSSNKRKPEHSKLLLDAGKQEDKPAEGKLASSDVHVEKKVKQEDVVITNPGAPGTEGKHKHSTDNICVGAFITDTEPVQGELGESTNNKHHAQAFTTDTESVQGKLEESINNKHNAQAFMTDTESVQGKLEESINNKHNAQAFTTDKEPVQGKLEESTDNKHPVQTFITDTERRHDKNHADPVDSATANKIQSDSPVTSCVTDRKFPLDVLIISDPEPGDIQREQEPSNSTGTKQSSPVDSPSVEKKQVPETKERLVPLNLNPDECTWDMLFDDNGDCLDPRLMEELTSAVGSVTIEKPKSDYRSYQSRVEMMLSGNAEDEFAHVLEIYNFPPEFKTHDLFTVFSPYMKNGFEIKWVDDTHALGVFSSALIAAEVLAADHPFVKTRPLHQATPESRMKARRSAEFLQPYRARPETCAAMARRLVTGALGVRLRTSAEEREAERRLLREARERKRLAARQRDEAWEGTLMSNK